jgi:hypothetical protein
MSDLMILSDLEAEQINGGLLNFYRNSAFTPVLQTSTVNANATSGNAGALLGAALTGNNSATASSTQSSGITTTQSIGVTNIGLVN